MVALAVVASTLSGANANVQVVTLASTARTEHTSVWAELGYDMVIKSTAEWNAMTVADFASYRAVSLMDPDAGTTAIPTFLVDSGLWVCEE